MKQRSITAEEGLQIEDEDGIELSLQDQIPEFTLIKKCPPPLFPDAKDQPENDLLENSLRKDVVWSLIQSLLSRENAEQRTGSWTAYNKTISRSIFQKSLVEYLPTIGQPPEYDVCKVFLDDLKTMSDELKIPHIFAHADEQVYARLAHLIWSDPEEYKNVLILMGGFHQLRVRQKTIYKRYYCLGMKKWFIDAGVIAEGSADMATEGRHYYRCMRLLKESFNALIQYRFRSLTNDLTGIQPELLQQLEGIKSNPTVENIENFVNTETFECLLNLLMEKNGTQSSMVVSYLEDVSSLLAMVRAVREGDFALHLQAEREMLKFCFAFDHVHYSRYLSYQHILLNDMSNKNHLAIIDLQTRGFGGSLSGSNFSSIHGDLITEVFNGETKGQAGPHRSGFSTNLEAVNNWVMTSHVHAKLKQKLNEVLNIRTQSVHKETTKGAKQMHDDHISKLVLKLKEYGFDPFSGQAREFTTGKEIDSTIVNDMLGAAKLGDELYKRFLNERMITGEIGFYDPIKRNNLKTGLKKVAKEKSATVLKVIELIPSRGLENGI